MKLKGKTIKFNTIGFIILVFLFAIILAKLFYISCSSVVDGINIKTFANNRDIKAETLYAQRGNIYDSGKEILAQNVTSYTVIAYLSESRTKNSKHPQHVVDKEKTAEELSKILDIEKKYILERLNQDKYQVEFGSKAKNITELKKQKIEALDLPGIDFISSSKRNYPSGDFASYIIGYAKKNENDKIVGEMGIEAYYDNELEGTDGQRKYQQDAYGYPIVDTLYIEEKASSGYDIYLTIDSSIQLSLENAVETLQEVSSAEWILFTLMDAKTGAIVGSATSPSFDPNTLEILNYSNPLTSYTYEPGSTMKVFSFMAAMENNKYNGDETYKSGKIMIGDDEVADANKTGWGTISYDVGFTYSSNVAATKLAQKVGGKKLKSFYKELGFGSKTNIELPGELLGKVDFKYDIEIANASFGQGISVTPIQMLQAMTVVTNNGIELKPYLVDKIVNPNNNEVVYEGTKVELGKKASSETIQKIVDLMDRTVNENNKVTGRMYKSDLVTVIGKTGTAQVADSSGGYKSGKYENIRSFIGAFPKENPEYIIYLVTKKLQSSVFDMGDAVISVIDNVSKNKNLSERTSDVDENNILTVPSYINNKTEDVIKLLSDLNVEPIVIGDGARIIKQYPEEKQKIYTNNKIFLLTNSNEYKMPDVIGWSSNEIISFCNLIGLKYKINNYGYVSSTSLNNYDIIDLNKTLEVYLENKEKKESDESEKS